MRVTGCYFVVVPFIVVQFCLWPANSSSSSSNKHTNSSLKQNTFKSFANVISTTVKPANRGIKQIPGKPLANVTITSTFKPKFKSIAINTLFTSSEKENASAIKKELIASTTISTRSDYNATNVTAPIVTLSTLIPLSTLGEPETSVSLLSTTKVARVRIRASETQTVGNEATQNGEFSSDDTSTVTATPYVIAGLVSASTTPNIYTRDITKSVVPEGNLKKLPAKGKVKPGKFRGLIEEDEDDSDLDENMFREDVTVDNLNEPYIEPAYNHLILSDDFGVNITPTNDSSQKIYFMHSRIPLSQETENVALEQNVTDPTNTARNPPFTEVKMLSDTGDCKATN